MSHSADTVYDVCVVGSGPAGIIVALEYARANPEKNIVLIEYGKENQPATNHLDDTIEIINKLNHHDPYECTNKGLGGTSATWGGRCVMYDEIDFTARQVIADDCTWNLELFKELHTYLDRAAFYFECGNPVFNLSGLPAFRNKRIAENFKEGVVTDSTLERWSMPTRFGARYKKEIEDQFNLTLLQGVEARDFSSPDAEGVVKSLKVRDADSRQHFEIWSRFFVIATGAQEATRILLRNQQLFNSVGKIPSALGKYYQGHVSGKIASVQFSGNPRETDYGFLRDGDGTYVRRRFQFSHQFLLKENLLNTAIWLDNPLYFDPKHRSGAMSFMYMAMITPVLGKKLAPPAIAHSVTKGKVNKLSAHFINILRGLPNSLIIPATIFYKRYCIKRKLPGIFLYSPQNLYALHFHSEQIPVASNRMELKTDGETLVIHYNLQDEDIQSVIRLHEALDEHLQKTKSGKLVYWYPKDELAQAIMASSRDGIHQNGTTRIANTPDIGVVDPNLKVWGTSNVYVCSSSVFPTSGQANPTFLIGVFAVRLAQYLTNLK